MNSFLKKCRFVAAIVLALLVYSAAFPQQFIDVAEELGVEDSAKFQGKSIHWVDYNGDDHLDLYVQTNYFILPYRPESSRLFENRLDSEDRFVDVASLVGAGVDSGLRRAVEGQIRSSMGWRRLAQRSLFLSLTGGTICGDEKTHCP